MKTTPLARNKSSAFDSIPMRLVVYCEGSTDEFALQLLSRIPSVPGLEVHIIGGSEPRNCKNLYVCVIRLAHGIQSSVNRLSAAETQSAQVLLTKCGPGNVPEVLGRYCTRIAANFVIITMRPGSGVRRWWSASLPERLACHFPVLAIPAEDSSGPFGMDRCLRWLVPLDGSGFAEAILNPLRSLASWLPSSITLLQPLAFAHLWRERVGRNHVASVSKMGPSIADSCDYLAKLAERGFGDSPTRVCCATDSDAVRSIIGLANSSAIDAVAIGLSNRWRMTRVLAAELNELLLHRLRKPVLLFGSASR